MWVKIFREFGHSTPSQLKVYKQCIQTYEQVEFKIFNLKINLADEEKLSEFEIEAYLRYLNSLALLLIQSWQQIVLSSLNAIKTELENYLGRKLQPFSKVKRSVAFCQMIEMEVRSKNYLKRMYISANIEGTLIKIATLKESVMKMYWDETLDSNILT